MGGISQEGKKKSRRAKRTAEAPSAQPASPKANVAAARATQPKATERPPRKAHAGSSDLDWDVAGRSETASHAPNDRALTPQLDEDLRDI